MVYSHLYMGAKDKNKNKKQTYKKIDRTCGYQRQRVQGGRIEVGGQNESFF